MNSYNKGEKLIWAHVDEKDNSNIYDFVTVVKVSSNDKNPHYTVTVDATNEVYVVWHKELHRYTII